MSCSYPLTCCWLINQYSIMGSKREQERTHVMRQGCLSQSQDKLRKERKPCLIEITWDNCQTLKEDKNWWLTEHKLFIHHWNMSLQDRVGTLPLMTSLCPWCWMFHPLIIKNVNLRLVIASWSSVHSNDRYEPMTESWTFIFLEVFKGQTMNMTLSNSCRWNYPLDIFMLFGSELF